MSIARTTSGSPEPRYRPHGRGDAATYRLAFDESLRSLEVLEKRRERIQTSYVALLAFVGSSSAFLAGSVLTGVERTATIRALSAGATALFATALVVAVWDLWPHRRPGGVDAARILSSYIETDVPASYEMTLAELTVQNAEVARTSRAAMRRMSIRFAVFLSLTTVSIALWISTAWIGDRLPSP